MVVKFIEVKLVALAICFVVSLTAFSGCLESNKINKIDAEQFKETTNIIKNSDFESGDKNGPDYWSQVCIPIDGLSMSWNTVEKYSGKMSICISNTHNYGQPVDNKWVQTIDCTSGWSDSVLNGKTIRLSGWMKTENVEKASISFKCLDKDGKTITTISTQVLTGTTDWSASNTQSVKLTENTEQILIEATLTGVGVVWFDDIILTAI